QRRADHRLLPRSSRPFQSAEDDRVRPAAENLDREGAEIPASRAGQEPALKPAFQVVAVSGPNARAALFRLLFAAFVASDRSRDQGWVTGGGFPHRECDPGCDAGHGALRYGLATT